MSPTRQRKSGPAEAPKIQHRPAEPAPPKKKQPPLDPSNRDGEFPPNPELPVREGRPEAKPRQLKVVGPKAVFGVEAPGWVEADLTEAQLDALLDGGHVEDWTGVEGWGKDPAPENEGDSPNEEGS